MCAYRYIHVYTCIYTHYYSDSFFSIHVLLFHTCTCTCMSFSLLCSNFAEAVRLIIEYGADVNSKDGRENTATMAAGALGHYEVLEILLGHHLLNLHAGVRS